MPETLTPPRAPRKDALENREAIVAAAATVFRREPEASLDAVAAEAGLSRRSIYGHFASRDELLAELLTRGGSRISTALAGVHHDDPRIHLALVGAALWAEVQQVRVLAQLAVHGPLERTVAEALEPVRASVRDAVARGVTAGWFRDDVAPETLARLIEEAAIAVLDEAVRADLTEPEGARLVMTIGLSVAGLSWQSAAAVADALPATATASATGITSPSATAITTATATATALTSAAPSTPAPKAAVSSPSAPAAASRPLAT